MAGDLIIYPLLSGRPRGIDQSAEPAPGTVYDCCNIDTCNGRWETRSGFRMVGDIQTDFGTTNFERCIGLYEFIPDPERATSRLYSMLGIFITGSTGATIGCKGLFPYYNNSLATTDAVLRLTLVGGATPFSGTTATGSPTDRCSFAEGLFRYTEGDITDYCQAVVIGGFSSGDLLVYHQKDIDTATATEVGTFEALTCISGGLSDVSYLTEPPKGKYVLTFKGRTFVLNCVGASNRVYHTGPDSAGQFPVNVWPAAYNFDVGGQEAITGAVVYQDRLYVFKENETWVVSGDGINGNWQVDLVDRENGALDQSAVVNTGAGFYYIGSRGIFFSSGGAAKNISHPRLRNLWDKLYSGVSSTTVPFAVLDAVKNRILFNLSSDSTQSGYGWQSTGTNQALVYDITNDSFTRYGTWALDNYSYDPTLPSTSPWTQNGLPARTVYGITLRNPSMVGTPLLVSQYGIAAGNTFITLFILQPDGSQDTGRQAASYAYCSVSPPALLLTNPSTSDGHDLVLREVSLSAVKTGDWDIGVLPIADGDDIIAAFTRTAPAFNVVISNGSAAEHTVAGTSNFQTSTTGPVDVLYMPTGRKAVDSGALTTATGTDKVKFTSAKSISGTTITPVVVKEDTGAMRYLDMSPTSTVTAMFDETHTFDDYLYGNEMFDSVSAFVGIIGSSFQVMLSTSSVVSTGSAPYARRLVVDGIDLVLQPKRTRRHK